jgi:voltage-gated potassium channel
LVFGYSKVAQEIVKYFDTRDIDFVLVSASQSGIDRAKKDNYKVYEIDYHTDEELKKFGIGSDVKTVFCLSNDFNRNLFFTLSVRNIDPSIYIVSLVSNKEEQDRILLAGASKTIDPYAIGANQFFTLMKKPKLYNILSDILYKDRELKLEQVTISAKTKYLDTPFSKAKLEEIYDVMILGLYDAKREKFKYNIRKILRKVKEGDTIVVMGKEKNIKRFKKELS